MISIMNSLNALMAEQYISEFFGLNPCRDALHYASGKPLKLSGKHG